MAHIVWRKSSYSATNNGCVEVGWHKSSYSATDNGCVEVGWHKSSYSTNNGDCVEVAAELAQVLVRDTKDRAAGALAVAPSGWRALLADVAGHVGERAH
jgi:nitrite reductase/ring-hydroxylating ferredoxin subunit